MNAVSTEVIPFTHLERMAVAVAKSGLFAVKTPEAALTLMLLAQAEGIHPAAAMTEFDLIQGRPSRKAVSMLARFQAAGGKVEWLEATDEKVSGRFSHPQGGAVVVTWDTARCKQAGLADKDMHKKFPQQMKRARCIGEGVRAVYPGVSLVAPYTTEEMRDMDPRDITPETPTVEKAIKAAAIAPVSALTEGEIDDHLDAMHATADQPSLAAAFSSAWKHAREAKDEEAKAIFQAAYEGKKQAFLAQATDAQP